MLFHLRYDLRIGELVRGLNSNNVLRQRFGAAEPFPQLQLGLTRPEDQNSLGLSQLTDDFVVVPLEMLTVAFLVFFLASSLSGAS